jgi:hypothetical protein
VLPWELRSLQSRPPGAVRPGVCEHEAEKLLGEKPVRIDRSVRAPKKIRDVPPKYPELPPGTIGSGMWIGEVLINNSGKIAHVWPIREVEFKPPFPAFDSAITDAIQQWEFEQLFVQGTAVPVCMTVTVNINWKEDRRDRSLGARSGIRDVGSGDYAVPDVRSNGRRGAREVLPIVSRLSAETSKCGCGGMQPPLLQLWWMAAWSAYHDAVVTSHPAGAVQVMSVRRRPRALLSRSHHGSVY